MAVVERERRHFAAVAEAMGAEKHEQRLEALVTTPAERVAIGFLLGAACYDSAFDDALDERAAAQIGLARRRRARSLDAPR
jgi:hypothetical protein